MCQTYLGNTTFNGTIHFATLCTIAQQGSANICRDDSGNPLASNGELIGIASWGQCRAGMPDGFTSVSVFVDWIQQVSGVVAV